MAGVVHALDHMMYTAHAHLVSVISGTYGTDPVLNMEMGTGPLRIPG